jgi:hypothetical protein
MKCRDATASLLCLNPRRQFIEDVGLVATQVDRRYGPPKRIGPSESVDGANAGGLAGKAV